VSARLGNRVVRVLALAALTASGAFAALASTACDPVHDEAVTSLGDEKAGVSPGPLHRPGQPCLVCHGGSGPGPDFTMGGTVFQTKGSETPVQGATVHIESKNGETHDSVTNEVGNFYFSSREFIPTYPLVVTVSKGEVTQKMSTHVGRDGSCAGCHVDPEGPSSPGRVWLYEAAP
jgi:hypothetical protein